MNGSLNVLLPELNVECRPSVRRYRSSQLERTLHQTAHGTLDRCFCPTNSIVQPVWETSCSWQRPQFVWHKLQSAKVSRRVVCSVNTANNIFTCSLIYYAKIIKTKRHCTTVFATGVFKRRHPHMDTFLHKFLLPRMLTANESQQFDLALYRGKTINVEPAGVFDHTLRLKLDPRRAFTSSKLKLAILRGYLQSWKYFQPCKSLVKYQFVFTRRTYGQAVMALSSKLQPLLKSSDGVRPTSIIGIHVRRGDILQPVHRNFGHTPASKEYFQHALDKMNCTHHPAVFIVVSNDLAWCKTVFTDTSNIIFMDKAPPSVDMAILSLTDHLILSVGSFGWWAAYLSDSRDVLYYRNWPRPLSVMAQGYISKDYFMPHWTAMD